MCRKSDGPQDDASDADYDGTTAGQITGNDPDRYGHLVEHIQDAVVEFELVENDPVVTDVNPAFVDVFGYDADDIVGSSLNEFIVPTWLEDEARRLDERTGAGEVNYRRVRRETATGLREFLYRSVPFEKADRDRADDENEGAFGHGGRGGFAVYTDLTESRRNESRIDVLHRLLRHNLRNQAGVLEGNLDRLVDRVADDPKAVELATVARTSATELEQLAREAREIQRTLDAHVPDDAAVDPIDLVRSVVESHRSRHPDAAIRVETETVPPVGATERLEVAVAELVTNAIVHDPDPEPAVHVAVRPAPEPGWVDVLVADDGPRIPAAEQSVIAGDAEITSTRHGNGLGLWLVRWTVERFGGELAFGITDGGGNEVRIRLPVSTRGGGGTEAARNGVGTESGRNGGETPSAADDTASSFAPDRE